MNKKLMSIVLVLTIMVIVGLAAYNQQRPSDELVQMKLVIMDKNEVVLYNPDNDSVKHIDWYFEENDLKSIEGSVWLYNYKDDLLYREKDGKRYNMQDEGL